MLCTNFDYTRIVDPMIRFYAEFNLKYQKTYYKNWSLGVRECNLKPFNFFSEVKQFIRTSSCYHNPHDDESVHDHVSVAHRRQMFQKLKRKRNNNNCNKIHSSEIEYRAHYWLHGDRT